MTDPEVRRQLTNGKRNLCADCGTLTWGKRCQTCFDKTRGTKGRTKPIVRTTAPLRDRIPSAPWPVRPVTEAAAQRAESRDERALRLLAEYRALADEGKETWRQVGRFDMHARFSAPSGGYIVAYRLAHALSAPEAGWRLCARFDCKGGGWQETPFTWGMGAVLPPGKPEGGAA